MRRCLLLISSILFLTLIALTVAGKVGSENDVIEVESDTELLFGHGGGHITWRISGEVVRDIRKNIDYNGDGRVQPNEAESYTNEMEAILEDYVSYMSASIRRTDLLNKDVIRDTKGLITKVNSTQDIEIYFYFSADEISRKENVKLSDNRIITAPIKALRDSENKSFNGKYVWHHKEINIGLGSFSSIKPDKGSIIHLRLPVGEVIIYSVEMKDDENVDDKAVFEPFNPLQCPLELFIVICVFSYFILYIQRYLWKKSNAEKKGIPFKTAVIQIIILFTIFFLGVDGILLWISSPLFIVITWAISNKIYRNVHSDLIMEKEKMSSKSKEEKEYNESIADIDLDDISIESPEPSHKKIKKLKKIRCPSCKNVFDVEHVEGKKIKVKCSECGKEGMI